MLGAGDSGKSTIFKQIKIIHSEGFDKDDEVLFKTIIYDNIVEAMKVIILASQRFGVPIQSKESQERVERISSLPRSIDCKFTQQIYEDIKALWADPDIQTSHDLAKDLSISDSATYYFEELDRLKDVDTYYPTTQDILHTRVTTTGIVEAPFVFGGVKFRLFDVGGQKSERKKWISCFGGCSAVIFCASLSEYDQSLIEEKGINRMHESLGLFDQICNHRGFEDSAVILFLNKTDLMQEKIKRTDLTVCFPEYKGGNDFETARSYVKEKFLSVNKNPDKEIFCQYICATDTDQVSQVFTDIRNICIRNHKATSQGT